MPDFSPAVFAVFQRHAGVATSALLERTGMTARTRQRLVHQDLLIPIYRGTYRLGCIEPTLESESVALSLTYPAGFVTGPAGGKLAGLRRIPDPYPIHFSVPHGLHVEVSEHVLLRQTTSIEPMDVIVRSNGLRLASWPRLAFDLARDVGELDHASIVEQLLADRRCTFATLVGLGRRLVHPGRAGSTTFARTLLQRVGGGPLESHAEVLVAKALVERGVPVTSQFRELTLPNGAKVRIDLAVEAVRWAVEIDVHPDHLLEGTTKDKRRDRQMHRIGWQVERVSPMDLLDLDALADELAALYEQRRSDIEVLTAARALAG